ncbi:MAG: hydrogenase small subunit [Hyphomicrobiaceae bacterium]
MPDRTTLGEALAAQGVSRRAFLKYASYLATAMALPASATGVIAQSLANARRQSVIWLSFQECTGCTESITRSFSPTLEDLIFNFISLDYHHTLQAVSGHAAEHAREQATAENHGKYIVIVDGSIPVKDGGVYSTIAGITNEQMLRDTCKGALAVVSVGTCAAFGGIPQAKPNPTGAVAVTDIIKDKPVVNIPGCPPIPEAMTGTIAYLLSFGKLPELDSKNRPLAFFGETIHDRCYRRPFYERGLFADSFDDEGARKGWCLFKVGCKGPIAYNACATLKWNGGVSFPIQSGHGCIGCSEPQFWDKGSFYKPLAAGRAEISPAVGVAAAAGAAAGAVGAHLIKQRRQDVADRAAKKTTEG